MKSQEVQDLCLVAKCKIYTEQDYVSFICDTKFSYK